MSKTCCMRQKPAKFSPLKDVTLHQPVDGGRGLFFISSAKVAVAFTQQRKINAGVSKLLLMPGFMRGAKSSCDSINYSHFQTLHLI